MRLAAAVCLPLSLLLAGACSRSAAAPPSIPPQAPAASMATAEPLDDFDDLDDFDQPQRSTTAELATMTLPPRPGWADKYAGSSPDERFLDIAALMDKYGFDRARAVEVQNHFRDLTRAQPGGDREAQYQQALQRVQDGIFEDRRDPKRLVDAPFIVVFDLDHTLYDQRYDDPQLAESCHDLAVPDGDGQTRYVKLTPGWDDAIRRIQTLGGEVVLFTANLDDRTHANVRAWTLDGVPIHEHPAVAALLTNSHLVLQPKQAGPPVVEPSKDLRILDPDLSRVIIVDDNPTRLFQFRNVRLFKKFQADAYCAGDDHGLRRAYDTALRTVVDEIEESLRYAKAHDGTRFADAYLPYTMLGRVAVQWLQRGRGLSSRKAIDALRSDPKLADERF